MSLSERLFGRKGETPQLDLAPLQALLADAAARRAGREVEPDLVRARLADGCRDAALTPLLPEEFDALTARLDAEGSVRLALLTARLDAEGWVRLALLVDALDLKEVRGALAALAAVRPLVALVEAAFVGLARETPLLTPELLRQSPLRGEELARRFIAVLGADVRGESRQASRQRLARLDYGRLLVEAEQARLAAAGRVEQLRKLQEEQEKRRPRRGKW
jgi:hypothetical protein